MSKLTIKNESIKVFYRYLYVLVYYLFNKAYKLSVKWPNLLTLAIFVLVEYSLSHSVRYKLILDFEVLDS